MASSYEIFAGNDVNDLRKVAEGEFSNIRNNPIMQEVYFTPINARYLLFKATRLAKDGDRLDYEKIAVQ